MRHRIYGICCGTPRADNMVDLLLLLAILSSAASIYHWIAAARAFDRLVKRMHDSNNEIWRRLDSPAGFFWRPRYSLREWMRAVPARNRLASDILFSRRGDGLT